MGFSQSNVTDDDRATAADVLRDCEIESAAAKELGKDVGAAVLRELAYSIGLIRCLERAKLSPAMLALVVAAAKAEQQLHAIISRHGCYESDIREALVWIKIILAEALNHDELIEHFDKARAALTKAV